jgi:methyltransferase
MTLDWGAALLAFLTLQRLAELVWAKRNETELLASGGVEFGRSHLWLIILFHAAWMSGLWLLGYAIWYSCFCSSFCSLHDFGFC